MHFEPDGDGHSTTEGLYIIHYYSFPGVLYNYENLMVATEKIRCRRWSIGSVLEINGALDNQTGMYREIIRKVRGRCLSIDL